VIRSQIGILGRRGVAGERNYVGNWFSELEPFAEQKLNNVCSETEKKLGEDVDVRMSTGE
jgi:hypothetical protein